MEENTISDLPTENRHSKPPSDGAHLDRGSFTARDVDRIAQELGNGRKTFRNRDGRKTFCPLCPSGDPQRRTRPTLSLTVRDGTILAYCHRCNSDGVTIIRELVRRGLLPDLFKDSSKALAIIGDVLAVLKSNFWNLSRATCDREVLHAVIGISLSCAKTELDLPVRQVALLARVSERTAARSVKRLAIAGWLERIAPAKGKRAAIWRIGVPEARPDREGTLSPASKEGNRLCTDDPFSVEVGRAGSARSVPSFDHDLFRRTGIGFAKGRIYALLEFPMNARDIASALSYKNVRNARIHLGALLRDGLVLRSPDGDYRRSPRNLDAAAQDLGVLGATESQRERYRQQSDNWGRWCDAFDHWRQTGEVVDPDTGEILETQSAPHKRTSMPSFRLRVLVLRRGKDVADAIEQRND